MLFYKLMRKLGTRIFFFLVGKIFLFLWSCFFKIRFIDLFDSCGVERKVPVIHNLCLQLAASLDWSLGRLEKILPPPLMLYLLQAYLQVSVQPVLGIRIRRIRMIWASRIRIRILSQKYGSRSFPFLKKCLKYRILTQKFSKKFNF